MSYDEVSIKTLNVLRPPARVVAAGGGMDSWEGSGALIKNPEPWSTRYIAYRLPLCFSRTPGRTNIHTISSQLPASFSSVLWGKPILTGGSAASPD